MDRKKGIIAIVLFIFLGLMVFSFANPAGDEATTKLDGSKSENVKEEIKEDVVEEQEEIETTTQSRTTVNSNLITGNSESTSEEEINEEDNNSQDEDIINDDEEENMQDDETVDNETDEKQEDEKDYSDIIAIVDTLSQMVLDAISSTDKEDMDLARGYNIDEKIEELVSTIEDEELKEKLTKKLEKIYEILKDETEPKPYSLAITNYTHSLLGDDTKVANTGDFVRVIAYFNEKLNIEPVVTIDGLDGEYELNFSEKMSTSTRYVYVRNIKLISNNTIEDGNILVKIISCKDMANNSCEVVDSNLESIQNKDFPYVNFDSTAPKFNIGNGASFESNIIEVIDENFDYMIIQDMTTGKKIEVDEPKYELKSDKEV